MKAEELMIGDWVQDRSGIKMKIMNIEYHCTRVLCNGEELILPCFEYANLGPIPLTSEILEKNGFVPSDEWKSLYYLNDGEDEFAFEINNCYQIWWSKECGNVLIAQLKYVHTLQHVLRLCGIDKEIVL